MDTTHSSAVQNDGAANGNTNTVALQKIIDFIGGPLKNVLPVFHSVITYLRKSD
jgi:hypothetical protein